MDKQKVEEAQKRVQHHIADGVIISKQKAEHVEFFLKNAEDSLQSARCLFEVSTKHDYLGYDNLAGFLWVINASYYSMFYMARALIESSGIKLKADLSIHALTFDTFVYYFYLTGKLQKQLFEFYAAAKEDAAELLGQQRAGEIIEEYSYEKRKREEFTYETGDHAMKSKAEMSRTIHAIHGWHEMANMTTGGS